MILDTPGIKWVSVTSRDGELRVIGKAPRKSALHGDVIIIISTPMAKVTFEYAVVDEETKTVRYHKGSTGDPSKDPFTLTGW